MKVGFVHFVKLIEVEMLELTTKRIYKARMTAIRAKSQWAKDYWNEVANELEIEMRLKYN